jgi:hypothetical protein
MHLNSLQYFSHFIGLQTRAEQVEEPVINSNAKQVMYSKDQVRDQITFQPLVVHKRLHRCWLRNS